MEQLQLHIRCKKGNIFEIITRAVIINRGKILLCHQKNKRYYFFPGGHIEFGESAKDALRRELKEEFGAKVVNAKLIGSSENFYGKTKAKHHELNLIFAVKLNTPKVQAVEDHIYFSWIAIENFQRITVLPKSLHKAVTNWLKDKKPFWASHKK